MKFNLDDNENEWCNKEWVDNTACLGSKETIHTCYLDKNHEGDCRCISCNQPRKEQENVTEHQ